MGSFLRPSSGRAPTGPCLSRTEESTSRCSAPALSQQRRAKRQVSTSQRCQISSPNSVLEGTDPPGRRGRPEAGQRCGAAGRRQVRGAAAEPARELPPRGRGAAPHLGPPRGGGPSPAGAVRSGPAAGAWPGAEGARRPERRHAGPAAGAPAAAAAITAAAGPGRAGARALGRLPGAAGGGGTRRRSRPCAQ